MTEITTSTSWEDDLESHRYELTRVLRPDRYFDKFRSERIFDESDTQEINNETKNPTRDKKAGHFLDIVHHRGQSAYKLLLECVEVDHPDLYKLMTGKDPEPKPWTVGLSRSCACECHDDRISLDLIEAYKKEKQQNIVLKKELTKLAKSVDKGREEKLKLKHMNEAQTKQLDVLKSETGDIHRLKEDIQWKRLQICDLQAKAYESQTELIAANDKLRKMNLENNTLQNKLREAQAKLSLQRKKSTRLEQESQSDRIKASDALRSLVDQLQELERIKKIAFEEVYKPVTNNDLHDQTTLEIMMSDKQEAVTRCEEAVNELVAVRKQLYDAEGAKTKLQAENEELDTTVTLLMEERDMLAERLEMAQDELTQVSGERSSAISERNRSFEETAKSMVERDELVKKLNHERRSFLRQTRQLFELKTNVQRLKRDKKLLLQDRPPSLVSSDSSNDSKRSSGAPDNAGYLESGTSTALANSTTKSSTTFDKRSPQPLETKRSISKQSSFDDDDYFSDYEYPVGTRKRSQQVTELPASLRNRRASNPSKSDLPTGLSSNRSSCRSDTNEDRDAGNASSVDHGDEQTNGDLGSLPCSEDRVAALWPDFDEYSGSKESNDKTLTGESVTEEDETSTPEANSKRAIMRSGGTGYSTDVNVGSLKDKKRNPGPRLSSCDFPASNYMINIKRDRRSKTLGSDPEDPNQALPGH